MSDKLTPGMLRDLANLIENFVNRSGPFHRFHRELETEAARREAEAKPVMSDEERMAAEWAGEGPGSAEAPKPDNDICVCGSNAWRCGTIYPARCSVCSRVKPKDAADIAAKELGQTASADAAPIVEREGLGSADAELVKRLRDVHPNLLEYRVMNHAAADRIEAQAREIANHQARSLGRVDYTVDLQRLIETICRGASILPAPETTAHFHRDMAAKYIAERDTLKARVAELEIAQKNDVAALVEAEAKAARLKEALILILPFASAYVANHDYGSNRRYIAVATAALAEAGHAG